MNSLDTNKTKTIQKDIQKGQKILAAIYLVTEHLSDTEPVRDILRKKTVDLICNQGAQSLELARQIEMVLGGAVICGLISEKNSSIIIYEINHFCENYFSVTASNLEDIFISSKPLNTSHNVVLKDTKKTFISQNTYVSNKTFNNVSQPKNILNKSARQDTILSFINDRKSAVIKDIVSLFPDVSEKTIQRELNTLIDSGRITKRGTKRWSMYMAVNSLL